ncbi:hypothetical protein B5M45_16415 [Mycobacterium simiae]|uniref:Uncharacterized protein n=1 Tax=Mycobacterium simiae TaxID=1784 RepID=A0A1X0Y2Z6_MYCSI|nr:hypothetical protein B5M45_16415 [Mycobacterium simiae]
MPGLVGTPGSGAGPDVARAAARRCAGPATANQAEVVRVRWAGRAADGPAGIRRARSWASSVPGDGSSCVAAKQQGDARAAFPHASFQYRANCAGPDPVPAPGPAHPPYRSPAARTRCLPRAVLVPDSVPKCAGVRGV